jgi:hypothetical protein
MNCINLSGGILSGSVSPVPFQNRTVRRALKRAYLGSRIACSDAADLVPINDQYFSAGSSQQRGREQAGYAPSNDNDIHRCCE